MRALVYSAPGVLELATRPDTPPGSGEVVVDVDAVGICGSDVYGWLGRSPGRVPPLVLGHEFVGRVAGRRVVVNPLVGCGRCARCAEGRPNICPDWRLLGLHTDGAMRERIVVPAANVVELSDDAPTLSMVLAEPLACAVHTVDAGVVGPGSRAAVIGLGCLGAMTVVALRDRGITSIDAIEPNAERAANAERFGARLVDPASAGSHAYDFVADCAGYASTRALACRLTRNGGDVLLVGYGEHEGGVNYVDVIRRELCLQGVMAYAPRDFARAAAILATGVLEDDTLFTIFPLERGPDAFEHARKGGRTIKTLISIAG